MSCYKTVWIYCDGNNCPGKGEAGSGMEWRTAKQARDWLRADGWINRGSLDFCPECVTDHDGQTDDGEKDDWNALDDTH